MPNDPKIARSLQSESDRKLLAQARATIDHSRQLLFETKPQTDPHRMRHPPHHVVSLIQVCGEWHVLVDEEGKELVTGSFEEEHYAVAYAERQRLRLGLDNVMRI
jgi:hypothetical protein